METVLNKISVKDIIDVINGIDKEKFDSIVKAAGLIGLGIVLVKNL